MQVIKLIQVNLFCGYMIEKENKCPLCGTFGKEWKEDPQILVCPNCDSVYSEFGIVLESQKEKDIMNLCN